MGRSYQARAARRGIDTERRVQRELERAGFVVAVRSAGSHGPLDLIAWSAHEVLAIQVKSVTKDRSWRPVLEELTRLCRPPFVRVQLWVAQYRKRGWLHKIEVPHHICEEETPCEPLSLTEAAARFASLSSPTSDD